MRVEATSALTQRPPNGNANPTIPETRFWDSPVPRTMGARNATLPRRMAALVGICVALTISAAAAILPARASAATVDFYAFASTPDSSSFSANDNCMSTSDACNVRAAINYASSYAIGNPADSEEVILAPGTYTLTQGFLQMPTLTLEGQGARASDTVIDGTGGGNPVLEITDFSGGGTPAVVSDLEITGGDASGSSVPADEGGGVQVSSSTTADLRDDIITGNTAPTGAAGIYNEGTLNLSDSTVEDNTVVGSSGAGIGAGILNDGGTAILVDDTIARNTISGGTDAVGAGAYSDGGGTLKITDSTIAGNTDPSGDDGAAVFVTGGGSNILGNDIVAFDSPAACATGTSTTITDEGGNDLYGATGCPLVGSDVSGNPNLANDAPTVPANEGGPTPTLSINSTSAAIGAGLTSICPGEDQRGASQPTHCAAGAYQEGSNPPAIVTYSVTPSGSGTVAATTDGNTCTATDCTAGSSGNMTLTATPAGGKQFVQWVNGMCAGQGATCSLTGLTHDTSEEAQFGAGGITVTGQSATAGTVIQASSTSPSAQCSGATCTAPAGANVSLTVEPNRSVQFTGWAPGGTCAGQSNPCVLPDVQSSEIDTADMELGPPPTPPGTLAMYVSTNGNDANPGTASQPVATIAGAIAAAASRGEPLSQILMANGSYPPAVISNYSALSIYGDLDQSNGWAPIANDTDPTTINGERQESGLLVTKSGNILVQQLTVEASPIPGQGGDSSYGVRAIDGSIVTLADVRSIVGPGNAGTAGATGGAGGAGTAGGPGGAGDTPADVRNEEVQLNFGGVWSGVPGCPGIDQPGNGSGIDDTDGILYVADGLCSPGPNGGPGPGDGGPGGGGGWGGDGQYPGPWAESGSSADDVANGAAGGAAGDYAMGKSTWCCQDGEPGQPGSAGASGTAGQVGANETAGGFVGTYNPGAAGAGGSGTDGGGGGGGGGGSGDFDDLNDGGGDGGGGGGAGGFGGGGGTGGQGGGGSFALYVSASSATVEYGSLLEAANGGNGGSGGAGGNGGAGGAGGKGSSYASKTVGAGGNGGGGGGGGPGGGGGGGAGGPSYAAYGAGQSTISVSTDTQEIAGVPGAGGSPGSGGGKPAPSGGGGPSAPCSANCSVSTTLPVQVPIVLSTNGPTVSVPVECEFRCSGTLTLNVSGSSLKITPKLALESRGRTVTIGHAAFSLPAGRRRTLHVTLSAAARKRLKTPAHSLQVTAVTKVRFGSGEHKTYTTSMTLTHLRSVKGHPVHRPKH